MACRCARLCYPDRPTPLPARWIRPVLGRSQKYWRYRQPHCHSRVWARHRTASQFCRHRILATDSTPVRAPSGPTRPSPTINDRNGGHGRVLIESTDLVRDAPAGGQSTCIAELGSPCISTELTWQILTYHGVLQNRIHKSARLFRDKRGSGPNLPSDSIRPKCMTQHIKRPVPGP